MRLGSAWAARTCTGNKHLKPHLYCDKVLCWHLSTIAAKAAEVTEFPDFSSIDAQENSAVLKESFQYFLRNKLGTSKRGANFR